MPPQINLRRYISEISRKQFVSVYGKVTKVIGLVIEAEGINASVGELCHILTQDVAASRHTIQSDLPYSIQSTLQDGNPHSGKQLGIQAEVVGFDDEKLLLMPLGDIWGIRPADRIALKNSSSTVQVGHELLGRVVDALGNPIDGKGQLATQETYPVYNTPPNCYGRKRITETLKTGIRAIDGLLTIGKGQRVGIFAGSGVGKSTLLGMIARFTEAEVNVIALIGERGREVREFIEDSLGEEGLRKSVVVAVTSDQPPLLRVQGALTATAIAEYFRDRGKNLYPASTMRSVLLVLAASFTERNAGFAVWISLKMPKGVNILPNRTLRRSEKVYSTKPYSKATLPLSSSVAAPCSQLISEAARILSVT